MSSAAAVVYGMQAATAFHLPKPTVIIAQRHHLLLASRKDALMIIEISRRKQIFKTNCTIAYLDAAMVGATVAPTVAPITRAGRHYVTMKRCIGATVAHR